MHCNCESAYEEHDLVECITSALDARDPVHRESLPPRSGYGV